MDNEINNIVEFWLNSAAQNHGTMLNLLASGDYNWALFIGHLVIEKTLKAIIVKKNREHAIFSHDLLRLAKTARLDIDDEKSDWLDTITTFNINARYDNYKDNFQTRCTIEFTEYWIFKIEELWSWLKNQL